MSLTFYSRSKDVTDILKHPVYIFTGEDPQLE